MQHRLLPLVVILLLVSSATSARTDEATPVVVAAKRYVATLAEKQRRAGVLPFAHGNRTAWTFLPGKRQGVTLREMSAASRDAALALVKQGLSDAGWTKVQGVFTLEQVLRKNLSLARRRRDSSWRDPLGYTVTIFGRPAMDTTWGWRIGGHHLSLHVTVQRGALVSGTPFFLGGSPAKLSRGPQAGFEPLEKQQTAGYTLLRTLSAEQLLRARLALRVPSGFVMQPGRAPTDVRAAGIPLSQLRDDQRARFFDIVEAFAESLADPLHDGLMRRARKAKPESLTFLWRGTNEVGRDHYFRLQGPSFVIEHWNQNNHIHSVWRDTQDEWGRSSLR